MASASAPHASAQPSAAIASAIISSGRDGSGASAAASAVQPSGTRRSRASMMAMSTSSRCTPTRLGIDYGRQRWPLLRPLLRPCACARVHMQLRQSAWRLVRETLTAQTLAFGGALRLRTGAVPLCGSGSAGLGGGAPVRAQRRRTPAQPTAHRPLPRDAARGGAGGAIDGVVCQGMPQPDKRRNKQTTKQPNKQSRRTARKKPNGPISQGYSEYSQGYSEYSQGVRTARKKPNGPPHKHTLPSSETARRKAAVSDCGDRLRRLRPRRRHDGNMRRCNERYERPSDSAP